MATVVAAVTAGIRLLGTRRRLAPHQAVEELTSEGEEAVPDFWPGLDAMVLRRRDRLPAKALTDFGRGCAGRTGAFTLDPPDRSRPRAEKNGPVS